MKSFVRSLSALLIAFGVGLLIVILTGGNPWVVLHALVYGAFGTQVNLAGTLIKSVPLLLTGLSVAIAFRAGLFNIGGEGQLYAGALAAAWLGGLGLGLPALLYLPLVLLAAIAAGGFGSIYLGGLTQVAGQAATKKQVEFDGDPTLRA